MDIPLNTPICLKAHNGNNLQNEFFWRTGRCNNQNTLAFEQLVLIQTDDEKIIIQSRWNGRNLQVQPNGDCVFANHNQDLWEKFDVEFDAKGKIYFISCHTGNVMQCDLNGFARCVNKNRLEWEAWTIIYLNSKGSAIVTSKQVRTVALTATGVVLPAIIGLVAGALVPVTMATFGTVVLGVGTFHAPLISGGCAAILQYSAATLVTFKAAILGGVAGAAVGSSLGRRM